MIFFRICIDYKVLCKTDETNKIGFFPVGIHEYCLIIKTRAREFVIGFA